MPSRLDETDRARLRLVLAGRPAAVIAHSFGKPSVVIREHVGTIVQELYCVPANEGRPAMDWSVPTRRQRDALRAIGRAERGEPSAPDASDAQTCCSQGWAVLAPARRQYRYRLNQYRLTEAGRDVLGGADA